MRLCMIPVSIFVSHYGITDLVNTIKIYTNLIKLFNFKIYAIFFLFFFLLKKKKCNNIWECHLNKYKFIIVRKSDADMHVFL